jgi:hypothetical protein
MSNTNYQKYLKYKLKYLELKNELEGDVNELKGGGNEYEYDELEGGNAEAEKLKNEINTALEAVKNDYLKLEDKYKKLEQDHNNLKKTQASGSAGSVGSVGPAKSSGSAGSCGSQSVSITTETIEIKRKLLKEWEQLYNNKNRTELENNRKREIEKITYYM